MTKDPMLLHNLYINETIAVILSPKLSLHDLSKPKYKNTMLTPEEYLENSDTNCVPR